VVIMHIIDFELSSTEWEVEHKLNGSISQEYQLARPPHL
jgi:hypothetical protein